MLLSAGERAGPRLYVTCPILRYHPAVVAQKAATVQILSGNRFRLGLGAGENLNEHVVGAALAVARGPGARAGDGVGAGTADRIRPRHQAQCRGAP
jgi:alkanesulfonate monooxygenase SsuD/methylene tetrahydromethanopterin reductase-like flavin-dependent oxidoreductase (luciferase family)